MFPLLRLIIVVSYCICKIIHYTSIQYTQVWWKSRVSCYALQQQWPGYIAKSGRVRVVIIIIIHIFKKKFRVSCCCALQQWPGSIAKSGRVRVDNRGFPSSSSSPSSPSSSMHHNHRRHHPNHSGLFISIFVIISIVNTTIDSTALSLFSAV